MANIYLKAAALGVVAGMRSMAAPALVSRHFSDSPSQALSRSPMGWVGSGITAKVLTLMAAGELGGDKLPNAPNRIAPGPLGGRAVMGGLCGAVVALAADESEDSVVLGAAIGAASAIASTFATFYLRRWVVGKTRLPDPVVATAEDALVLGLASRVFAE